MSIRHTINKGLTYPLIRLIRIYQLLLSPDKSIFFGWLKGSICHHTPHCSKYGIQVLRRYGLFPGIVYMVDRITSCTGGSGVTHDPASYRVVFCSSAPIGVPFLEALEKDSRYDVVGVVTNPDEPSGRGMKIRENIIKSTAKKIRKENNTPSNIILLDGFGGDGNSNRFPRFKKVCKEKGITAYAPPPYNTDSPVLEDQIAYVIEQCGKHINENTIIIGQSLGGLLACHVIEKLNKKIGKLVVVASSYPHMPREKLLSNSKRIKAALPLLKKYTSRDYNAKKIQDLIQSHTVFLSTDDPFIPYAHAKEYLSKQFPQAEIISYNDKGHFGYRDNIFELPEILPFVFSETEEKEKYINTPRSLRLTSKKYATDAQEFHKRLLEKKPDLLVVIAYGKIIPQHILDIPRVGPINVHGSLLPEYRGASPIQSVLLDGKTKTGITIMRMEAGLDTGPMIDKKDIPLGFETNALDLIEKMKECGPTFLNNTMWDYGKGHLDETKQDHDTSTHCGKLEKTRGLIDPYNDTLEHIRTTYKGCYLRPKTYLLLDKSWIGHEGKQVILDNLKIDESLYEKNKEKSLFNKDNTLNDSIIELYVKPAGSKSMMRQEFLMGYKK